MSIYTFCGTDYKLTFHDVEGMSVHEMQLRILFQIFTDQICQTCMDLVDDAVMTKDSLFSHVLLPLVKAILHFN